MTSAALGSTSPTTPTRCSSERTWPSLIARMVMGTPSARRTPTASAAAIGKAFRLRLHSRPSETTPGALSRYGKPRLPGWSPQHDERAYGAARQLLIEARCVLPMILTGGSSVGLRSGSLCLQNDRVPMVSSMPSRQVPRDLPDPFFAVGVRRTGSDASTSAPASMIASTARVSSVRTASRS